MNEKVTNSKIVSKIQLLLFANKIFENTKLVQNPETEKKNSLRLFTAKITGTAGSTNQTQIPDIDIL